MKIGIMSDTHNNLENTLRALEVLRQRGIERIIHCGDISTPQIVERFAGWRVDFVFGNIDYDRPALIRAVARLGGSGSISDEYQAVIDGVALAACHGHESPRLDRLIHSGTHRWVFHGHTHTRREEIVGGTRVINPGALGGTHRQTRSVCLIDLPGGEVEFIDVAD